MVEDRKEVLPLRIVAARFISTDDQAGLAELDRITAEAWRVIQRRYWLLSTSFTAAASATVATLLSGIALTWSRSEEHTSELQSLMRISYAVFCLKKKKTTPDNHTTPHHPHPHT